jgi:sugar-specific transcriptional regulator TrmB
MKRLHDSSVQLIACLKSLGMINYEARVSIALLRVMSATAREIHELSGVPRASVYPVIDLRREKNLISVSRSAPKRFVAMPTEEAVAIFSESEGFVRFFVWYYSLIIDWEKRD